MNDNRNSNSDRTIVFLSHPLRGLASEGAEEIINRSLADLPGIAAVHVSSGIAIVEVQFDESVVKAEDIRARLEQAGVREQSP